MTRTIKYIRTLISGEALREYDELASKVLGKTNDHLNFIKEGLLVFFTQSMHFPSRKAQCAAQCVNLETYLSRDSPHD